MSRQSTMRPVLQPTAAKLDSMAAARDDGRPKSALLQQRAQSPARSPPRTRHPSCSRLQGSRDRPCSFRVRSRCKSRAWSGALGPWSRDPDALGRTLRPDQPNAPKLFRPLSAPQRPVASCPGCRTLTAEPLLPPPITRSAHSLDRRRSQHYGMPPSRPRAPARRSAPRLLIGHPHHAGFPFLGWRLLQRGGGGGGGEDIGRGGEQQQQQLRLQL